MMTRFTFVVLGALVAAAVPSAAHHSVLTFDGTTPTVVAGTVSRVLWQNPHTYVEVEVRGGGGVETWRVESEAAAVLTRLGWSRDALSHGTPITVTGARARDGRRLMRCTFVELDYGRRLPCFPTVAR